MPDEPVFEVFGRPDINEVMDHFRSKLSVPLDGTNEGNRRFAKLLIDSLKKSYPDVNPVALVRRLIDVAMEDKFWSTTCTSFRTIYNNKGRLILLAETLKAKKEAEQKVEGGYRIVKKG